MKIYLAASWKKDIEVRTLAEMLRDDGFEVDCFADQSSGRFVFSFEDLGPIENETAKTILQREEVIMAFMEDKKGMDWCDVLVALLPAGISTHMEAGYVKGQGKGLAFISPCGFPKGKVDVMYLFADAMCGSYTELVKFLKDFEEINGLCKEDAL